MSQATCSVDGCERATKSRGWCAKHYLRWWKHGDALMTIPAVRPRIEPAERFWPKVDLDGPIPEGCPELGPCWIWTGAHSSKGYGSFGSGGKGKTCKAHRFAYELLVGPIPDGLVIDHLCRNHGCVNPGHLEPVTGAENVRRGESFHAQKTHCPQGHQYDEANTYRWRGQRQCIACLRERTRAMRLAQREQLR